MSEEKLKFEVLPDTLGVSKLNSTQNIPQWAYQGSFFAITKTSDELSIVCPEMAIPEEVICERGWRALKIVGILDFSLIGILSVVSTVLANAGVSIFAISTYNTDYLLVKDMDLECALRALRNESYIIVNNQVLEVKNENNSL
ncbi:MAG: amino acid-binding protein [Firmicutes bacterium]|nr:amino acid-binding protein [Bacillota bacterium]